VKELIREGQTVKDPESKSRIARLTGLDRRVQFRIEDLQRSIEVARRKKRGRKAKGT
jgi:hypothetical protein